ncbi:hypothetical protein RYA05_03925 [Pseudomonas syringae pv. actinidiae]|nr:hypothetical protein [Pseudomonas syringae pv. actinidiae]
MKLNICLAIVTIFALGAAVAAESPAPTFRTVDVNGQKVQLASTSTKENGKLVVCQQYIKSISVAADGVDYTVTIDKTCHSGS